MTKRKRQPLTLKEEDRKRKAIKEKRRLKPQDPEYRAAINAKNAEYRRLKRLDPVYRAIENAKRAEYRRLKRQDPVYRAIENAKRAEYRRLKRQDPVYRAIENAKSAEYRRLKRQDPVYRAQEKEKRTARKLLQMEAAKRSQQNNSIIQDVNQDNLDIKQEIVNHDDQAQTSSSIDLGKNIENAQIFLEKWPESDVKLEPMDFLELHEKM